MKLKQCLHCRKVHAAQARVDRERQRKRKISISSSNADIKILPDHRQADSENDGGSEMDMQYQCSRCSKNYTDVELFMKDGIKS